MKREIKFRAWNGKRMWFDVHDAYDYICGSDANNGDNIPATTFAEIAEGSDRWVSMQFTGLLDSKGKEIYEGDILKHQNQYSGNPYAVEWFDGSFNISEKEDDLSICAEIIGNIYENPELL